MAKDTAARIWLDEKMNSTFSDFVSIPLLDMPDEDIDRLYILLKKYKHRLFKEKGRE